MKTLVVYYSAEGHTKKIAEIVANDLDADIYEIVPEKPYSMTELDWTNPDSRVSQENDNPILREMTLQNIEIPGWSEYERIVLCYPIWWGVAAWPVNAFVKTKDWNGKIIWPVCTSHSSGLGESDLLLSDVAGGGDWQEGVRFFQDANETKVRAWCEKI